SSLGMVPIDDRAAVLPDRLVDEALEELVELALVEGLALDERPDESFEGGAMAAEQKLRVALRPQDERAGLLLDGVDRLVAHQRVGGDAASEEWVFLIELVSHRADRFAHAVARDHPTGDVAGAAQIVLRAGGNAIEHDALGNVAAEEHANARLELAGVDEETVVLRPLLRGAERHAARNDADPTRRIGVRRERCDERVAALVDGDAVLFLGAEDELTLGAHEDL